MTAATIISDTHFTSVEAFSYFGVVQNSVLVATTIARAH